MQEYYKAKILPELEVLEMVRRSIVFKIILLYVVVVGIALFFLYLYIKNNNYNPDIAKAGIFLTGSIYILGYYFITKKYKIRFKQKIISSIVNFIDPEFYYSEAGGISDKQFKESCIFEKTPDIFTKEDFVKGMLKDTTFEFSEVKAEYSSGDKTYTFFKGLFFIADFNKNFNGKTLVQPEFSQNFLGKIGEMLHSKSAFGGKFVKLEDLEFEKLFVVYSTDQIESRYILSLDLMRRITDFRNKLKKEVYISFVNSKVFVAIPKNKNLFEPRIFRTLLDFSQVQEYFEDLQLAIDIVEDLNLNTRIWSKQ